MNLRHFLVLLLDVTTAALTAGGTGEQLVVADPTTASPATDDGLSPASENDPSPPRMLRLATGYAPLVWPDGTIEHLYTQGEHGEQVVMRIRSTDSGASWSEPDAVLPLPADGHWAGRSPQPLIDREGNLHLFLLDLKPAGMATWHTRLDADDGDWSPLQHISPNGPQTAPIQLRSGRLVVPIGYFLPDRPWDHPLGRAEITTYTSDDGGDTWHRSPVALVVACRTDYAGRHSGGYEPVLVERNDGRIWMVIRTQNGWLYESFSDDGIDWSEPRPTEFRSSDAPGALTRLPSGELILVWNNCDIPSPVDGQWIYTGRDALHAAISRDDGRSWQGYREVYLDPRRDEDPPQRGDRGTAYPNVAAAPDGSVYLVAGQGEERCRLLRIDPAWLTSTAHADDFSTGLDGWSVFKSYGPVSQFRRARVAGAQRVAHPSREGAWVLHVRRPDEKPGDGAAWNFPASTNAKLTLRIRANEGFAGGLITLTDRFIYPDDTDLSKVAFALALAPGDAVAHAVTLEPGRWHTLELAWEVEHVAPRGGWPGRCVVSLDGQEILSLPQLHRAKAGLSYIRLHSTAASPDVAGFLVDRVAVSGGP